MGNEEKPPQKKPYETPTVTELNREQARLKLMGHAMMGSKEAEELLELFFENEKQENEKQENEKQDKDDLEHKKSA